MDIVGLILLALLIYVRPQDFIPALSEARLVVWVMFFTVAAWATREARHRTTQFPLIAVDWWLLCLVAVVVLSTIQVRWMGFTAAVTIELTKDLLFFIMISCALDTEKKLLAFLSSVLFFTTVMCGLACLLPLGIDVFNVGMVGEGRIQGPGIFHNPNYLAYAAIFPIPIAVLLTFRLRNPLGRVLGAVSLCLLVLTVVLTKSRGGMIAMLVVASYLLVQRSSIRVRWIAGVLAGAGVLILMKYGAVRMGSLSDMRGDAAILGRIDSWYAGILMLKSSPLLGIGYGQYLNYFHLVAHSSFVQVAAETGLVGLFLWTGLLYHAFRGLRHVLSWEKVSPVYR